MEFVSNLWKDFYHNMNNIIKERFPEHPVIKQAIAVNIGYDFLQHVLEYKEEYYRIMKTFKEHSLLMNYAKDRYGIKMNKASEQYVYQLCILLRNYPELKNIDILEIGVGFGGLAKIILETEPEINSYTLLDNEEMLNLAKYFTDRYKKIKYVDVKDINKILENKYDLLISNYCLTETTIEYVDFLCKNVFPNCKNIFIIDGGKEAQEIQKMIRDYLGENKNLTINDYPALPHQKQKVYIGKEK